MNWDTIDWLALERMRTAFLAGTAGAQDYWRSESDLAAYDATFAQRIGWKWDFVLTELQQRGWTPPAGELLDWGCGSGVAGRAFLDHFGTDAVTKLRVWDRSALAISFAARRAREKYPQLVVATNSDSRFEPLNAPERRSPDRLVARRNSQRADQEIGAPVHGEEANVFPAQIPSPQPSPRSGGERELETAGCALAPGTLLISHVLTELTQEQTAALVELAATAQCVLWVEPGTYEASLTLIAIRERLRSHFQLVAPCTHQQRCGILAPENERHWCHHFATPPPDVFTDSGWARFANLLEIDLRDLPLSFLVLDRRPAPALPADAARLIGHPRLYKGHALLLGCDATGVTEQRLTQRVFPQEFKSFKKGRHASLCQWRCRAGEVEDYRSLD